MKVPQTLERSRSEKFAHLCNDPDFRQFLDEVVDKRMAEKVPKSKRKQGNIDNVNVTDIPYKPQAVKSPSDTTIYSPGLRRVSNEDVSLIEKISNFVESIRLDGKRDNGRTSTSRQDSPMRSNSRPHSANRSGPSSMAKDRNQRSNHPSPGVSYQQQEDPDRVVDQLLLQAEKFKAKVEALKGKYNFQEMLLPYDYDKLRSKFVKPEGLAPLDSEILFLQNFDQDDEFFHVTSEIEPSLRAKIERGEFVDLERLLPKDRNSRLGSDDLNKQLYQLITQGTNNFLEPPMPKTNGKINSIRKWDQAFRVFAAIYTHANPQHASEIWQYVYIIHTAAASNPWDNVYFYDINFRELMASKPWRSWGKTYTQGWNMAFNNNNATAGNNWYSQGNSTNKASSSSGRSWKDDCC